MMVIQSADILKRQATLTFQRPLIPLTDLQALGDPGKQYAYPGDVGLMLAYLIGASEVGPKVVSLTHSGAVRVATIGSGLDHIEPHEGTVNAGAQTVITFTNQIQAILAMLDDEDWTVEHSIDGVTFDPGFTIRAYERLQLDVFTAVIRLTNTGQSKARFRVWGLWFEPLPPGI